MNLINRLLDLVGYDPDIEYKNRILYLMDLATILVAGFFLILYMLYIPFLPAILVHVVYISFEISLYWFLKKRYFRFVKYSLILAHMIQLTLAVFVWFPVDTGFGLYYIMVPMVTFLVMDYKDKSDWYFAIGSSVLATFLYCLSEVLTLEPMYITGQAMNRFINACGIVFILMPMIYIFSVFSREVTDNHEKLALLAGTDTLTKLANRRVLFEEGIEEFALSGSRSQAFTLMIFDIDHFKHINDHHGHPGGDSLLKALVATIQTSIRMEDTFARYGGEEFGILLRGLDRGKATALADEIRVLVETTTFDIYGKDVNITISIGLAQYNRGYKDFDQMMNDADKALYKAKNSGRNKVVVA